MIKITQPISFDMFLIVSFKLIELVIYNCSAKFINWHIISKIKFILVSNT